MKVELTKKQYPFLTLCLSMAWVSVASEMPHFAFGRPSFAGALTLQCMVVGLIMWGVLDLICPRICRHTDKYVPLLSGAVCIIMSFLGLFVSNTVVIILHGVMCGVFFASSLIEYLHNNKSNRYLIEIGISAGIFTTAVYPFGALYTLLSPHIPSTVLSAAAFVFLGLCSFLLFYLRANACPVGESRFEQFPISRQSWITVAILIMTVIFAALNHLLNSGILEQNGGTVHAPAIFFVNVVLRLPMGFLIGWLAYKGKWYYAVGFPLALMIAGCAVSLFAGDGAVNDYAMLGIFNCGGAGLVILIHIFGMQAAIWRGNRSLVASFGALLHFTLVAFFNMNALHIAPEFFGEHMRAPITLLVIITGIPLFFLLMLFLVNHRLTEEIRLFFKVRSENNSPAPPMAAPDLAPAFSKFESKIAAFLIDGLSQRDIARKLHLTAAELGDCIKTIRSKVSESPCIEGDERLLAIAKVYSLTKRETDMLRSVCQNKTNPEIAAELYLSEATVKTHMSNLLKKLPVDGRAQVADWVLTFPDPIE